VGIVPGVDVLPADLADQTTTTNGSGLVGYLASGTGAVGRTLHSKLGDRPLLPEDYGAVGDGVTDDYVALNNCLIAAMSGAPNTTPHIDMSRRYRSSGTLTITSPVRITGIAAGFAGGAAPVTTALSAIVFDAGISGLIYNTGAQYSSLDHVEIESASIAAGADVGITINCRRFYGEHVNVSGFGSHGWLVAGNSPTTSANHGTLIACRAHSNYGDGFHFTGTDANVWTLVSLDATLNAARGIFFDAAVFAGTNINPHALDNGPSGQPTPIAGALIAIVPVVGDYVDAGGSNNWIAPYSEGAAGYAPILWFGGNYGSVTVGSYGSPTVQFLNSAIRGNTTVQQAAGSWGHQRLYDLAGSGGGHTYVHYSGQVAANAYSLRDEYRWCKCISLGPGIDTINYRWSD